MNQLKISIVISTYGRVNEIKKMVESIEKNFPPDSYEIIVVSSDDPLGEKISWLKQRSNLVLINPDVRVGSRKKSLYYYLNIGIRECKHDFILTLNDDFHFDENFYPKFVKCEQYDVIYFKTHIGKTSLGTRIPIVGYYKTPKETENQNLYLADIVIVKKDVFDKIGLLDEGLDWYGVGVDLSLRFAFSDFSFKVLHNEDMYVNHDISPTDRQNESASANSYWIYLEEKFNKFVKENNGYSFKVNW